MGNVLVEVNAAVGEFAEGSLLLELCGRIFRQRRVSLLVKQQQLSQRKAQSIAPFGFE